MGSKPFGGITEAAALASLRAVLALLGIPGAQTSHLRVWLGFARRWAGAASYRTHDFRRGHAEDMREKGATLVQILRAGEWRRAWAWQCMRLHGPLAAVSRSAAFLSYLEQTKLEEGAVMEAHLDTSDEED